jgi:hypothetical protein
MFPASQLLPACLPLRETSVHSASAFTRARPGRYAFPLFSFSYALFYIAELAIASLLNKLHTLCTKQPGWGDAALPPFRTTSPAYTQQNAQLFFFHGVTS